LCVCTGSIVVWTKLNVKLHSTPLTLKIIISVLVGLNFNNHLEKIYLTFIRPVLEYASEVWDNCGQINSDSLEKVQLEAARIVTGLPF
jgi:hypothetical protein